MRWIGIDEAGYGPNLGPLVMTAVVAEGPDIARPDPWLDCSTTVCRSGSRDTRLWIDDSKRLYRHGVGLDRLDAAALAVLDAAGLPRPSDFRSLLTTLGVDPDRDGELLPWLPIGTDSPVPHPSSAARVAETLRLRPFASAPWRIVSLRSVVIGPSRFNQSLDRTGSKALLHFSAFAELLCWAWDMAADGLPTFVRSDKHGGRHFYADLIRSCLPPFSVSITPGPEGPDLSRYQIRSDAAASTRSRSLTLDLLPHADADDALVSLASILSKLIREYWMTCFNAYWAARVPGLKPSAGYPVDASRFRRDLLASLPDPDPPVSSWWRIK
ncbi:ribonuclease H family protein [Tautonia rosea]|uniref:hypothetical protein n=1 Tax=Tautonia rosea TaxID=2728037 RepID=UPI00147285BA|nr:hypothetical protein [Tautonia rosea]